MCVVPPVVQNKKNLVCGATYIGFSVDRPSHPLFTAAATRFNLFWTIFLFRVFSPVGTNRGVGDALKFYLNRAVVEERYDHGSPDFM